MANLQLADSKYEETWSQFLSMVERNPQLKAADFYNSVAINKTGFKQWLSSHGYGESFGEMRSYARKLLMEPTQIIDDEQEVSSEMDSLALTDNKVTDNPNEYLEESTQYWWLNVDSKTWDIEKANIDDEKTISFFEDKKNDKEGFKGTFLKWLYCYFIDREDNPHFSHPININEPGISYLDYVGQKIDRKSVESARNMVRKAEALLLGNIGIVTNPTSVLGSKSYIKDGNRSDRSWVTPESNYSYGGKQRRRVLNAASRGKVDYFYRNRPNEIPKNAKERLLAPQIDPELGFPNIRDIRPFALVKEGDVVFACSTSRKHIFALLQIISKSENQIGFKIIDKLDIPCPISELKEPYCNYSPGDNLGFFRLTSLIGKDIIKGIEKETGVPVNETSPNYCIEDLLHEVYIDEKDILSILDGLNNKKNIILQGAPGVGKTYLAKKLAFARIGKKHSHRVCSVQFHPNYTYEDFIMGYKPDEKGNFKLQEGVFMDFCKSASKDKKSNDYYFIIDEINRGNLSKIFGEAFTIIENNHRGETVKLAYPNKTFRIPKNVYIIGVMNTADRSLAMLDIALRRRFAFFTLKPAFQTPSFQADQKILENGQFNEIIKCIEEINDDITKEPSLGEGFCIGHSFFCNDKGLDATRLKEVVEYEIIPLLREYWFDNDGKFEEESEKLLKVFE